MRGVKVFADSRGRWMAVFMLLFAVTFAFIPFLMMRSPRREFPEFFYAWYGFLILWSVFWVWFFIRNPRFAMLLRDGTLEWVDGLSKQASGTARLNEVRELRVETTGGQEDNWTRCFLVMKDGDRRLLSPNITWDPEAMLVEFRKVNPLIQLTRVKL